MPVDTVSDSNNLHSTSNGQSISKFIGLVMMGIIAVGRKGLLQCRYHTNLMLNRKAVHTGRPRRNDGESYYTYGCEEKHGKGERLRPSRSAWPLTQFGYAVAV